MGGATGPGADGMLAESVTVTLTPDQENRAAGSTGLEGSKSVGVLVKGDLCILSPRQEAVPAVLMVVAV